MTTLVLFALGITLIIGLLVWLYLWNARDLQALGKQLGLTQPTERIQERLQDRGIGRQFKELEGVFNGKPLQIWQRHVRMPRARWQPRKDTYVYTMVVRPNPNVARNPFPTILVEPRLRGELLDVLFGDLPEANLGDSEFQASFRIATPDQVWASRLFDAEVRAALLDLRSRWIGGSSALARLADATGLGWIEIDAQRLAFLIPGTPTATLVPKITDAVNVLDRITQRIESAMW